ncbi:DUF5010 domain-containing protein [Cohnella endophytica]|nr:DUF5010 domain-containing protein [Cohnella endophytica]
MKSKWLQGLLVASLVFGMNVFYGGQSNVAHAVAPGDTIALKSYVNGKFVSADNGGANSLIANKNSITDQEKFVVVDAGGGTIALKAVINNKYVTAESAGVDPLIARATAIGPWEKFTIETATDGRAVLKASVNNLYVSADNAGAAALKARASTIGVWEKFDMLVNPVNGTRGGYVGVTFGFSKATLTGGPYSENPTNIVYNQPLFKATSNEALFWDNYVEELTTAGVDFIAPTVRGYLPDPLNAERTAANAAGDTRKLADLVAAITRRGSNLKISILDDNPATWWQKKNVNKYGDNNNRPKFDIGDANGTGEGGYAYVWDRNYRVYFQTVPDSMRFKLDDRPVIYLWSLADAWFTNQGNGNARKLLEYVRSRAQAEFGVNPFIIVDQSWLSKDPTVTSAIDGVHSWFNGNSPTWSLTNFGGRNFGVVAPSFEKPNENQYTDPNHGQNFITSLNNTVGSGAFVTLAEGYSDWEENCSMWRVKEGGYTVTHYDYLSQRLNILRRYTSHPTLFNVRMEAEAADAYNDTTTGNTGGVYRDGNLDIQVTTDSGGGWNVGWIEPSEWLEWKEVPIQGSTHLRLRIATPNAGERIRFEIDGVAQAWINLPNTGGWQSWQTVDGGVYTLSAGNHTIRLYTDTGGYNLNYWINN